MVAGSRVICAEAMRLATYNLESLDLPPKAKISLDERAEVLRPVLERLDADILCLQEVNGQHVAGKKGRALAALDRLLAGTRYADYARAATTGAEACSTSTTSSRCHAFLRAHREVLHGLVRPPQHQLLTAPRPVDAQAVRFDRPLLVTEVALADGGRLTVVNLHLRAPLANVPGQKIEPLVWKTVGGWAEGFFLSAIRRAGQALELRLLLEQLFDSDPHSLIAVAGDFNAEDRETPLRLAIGAEEDTGNGASPRDRSCCSTARFPRICAGACCTMAGRRCSITSSQAERCTVRSARSRSTTKRWVTNSSATARGYARRRPITPLWLRSSRPASSFRVDALAFWHRRHSVERPRPSSVSSASGS